MKPIAEILLSNNREEHLELSALLRGLSVDETTRLHLRSILHEAILLGGCLRSIVDMVEPRLKDGAKIPHTSAGYSLLPPHVAELLAELEEWRKHFANFEEEKEEPCE